MRAVWAVSSMLAAGAERRSRDRGPGLREAAHGSWPPPTSTAWLRESQAGDDGAAGEPDVKSAATMLVELAQEHYTFGVSDTGEPFALPQRRARRVVAMLRGGKTSLRALLAREYFTRTGRAADAAGASRRATGDRGHRPGGGRDPRLYLRTAQHEGALWLDLGDHDRPGRPHHRRTAGR